jgi:hypothetical protein
MVRSAFVVVALSFVSFACASSRAAAPSTAPQEIRFARGLLRTASPGPDWSVGTDVIARGPDGSTARFPLMLHNPKTGSNVGVFMYETAVASPVMMADRMESGMRTAGAVTSEVDFSVEDGSRASLTFSLSDGANTASGKVVTVRLNDVVSVAVIGTWTPPRTDEAAVDAVAAGLGITPRASR